MRVEATVTFKVQRYNGEKYITIEGEIRPEELK